MSIKYRIRSLFVRPHLSYLNYHNMTKNLVIF